MKQKYYIVLVLLVTIVFIVIGRLFFKQNQSQQNRQALVGIIRSCEYSMGESTCGRCYCLETPEEGCEIIDISEVGDLDYAVDKTVSYEGTRDRDIIQSTKMCPHHIKLFKITIASSFF